MTIEAQAELVAWREFCQTLSALGERLLDTGLPADNPDITEAVRHLATQSACWLAGAFAAEQDLGMYRLNDLLTPWGGPNADNVYHYARVDDQGTYRLHGNMHSCEEFLLALRIDNLHAKNNGTLGEATATELGLGPDSDIDLIFSPSGEGGIAIPPGTRMIAIREYYFDWRPLEPATLMFERLDGAAPDGGVVGALAEAAEQLTRSLTYWADYMQTARGRGDDNTFIAPRREPRGLQTMHYSFCFWSLQPGEALVVRLAEPEARYWSLQLYQLGWFESLDIGKPTSLNQHQAITGPDGIVTVVLCATDPGLANWLDTDGREAGLLTFRGAWLSAPAPQASAEVVRLDELETVLGDGEPRLDEAGRAQQIATRREHLRWRFRT